MKSESPKGFHNPIGTFRRKVDYNHEKKLFILIAMLLAADIPIILAEQKNIPVEEKISLDASQEYLTEEQIQQLLPLEPMSGSHSGKYMIGDDVSLYLVKGYLLAASQKDYGLNGMRLDKANLFPSK